MFEISLINIDLPTVTLLKHTETLVKFNYNTNITSSTTSKKIKITTRNQSISMLKKLYNDVKQLRT